MPSDGAVEDLATLLRWDDLTRSADFIRAKHILFLMDACYGGLAVKRSLKPGSMRFVKDMLLRPSRQVLAAGKANEVVDDSGGPRPGHSPFTGHLLDALSGRATDPSGFMTGHGVMAYVYGAVGTDNRSEQTPHYGQIDGDGDFIFRAPGVLDAAEARDPGIDEDTLMAVPVAQAPTADDGAGDLLRRAKEYLSEDRNKLQLFDLLASEFRRVIALTGEDRFASHGHLESQAFLERVAGYDDVLSPLIPIQALLGYWATPATHPLVVMGPKRLADQLGNQGGQGGVFALRWYPCVVLLYATGVAAVAGSQWGTLAQLFGARTSVRNRSQAETLPQAALAGLSDVAKAFNLLPGHERHYVAQSEYLFKLLQPPLDDVLFLGADYEAAFDRFEVFLALESLPEDESGFGWPLPGRFGYKYVRHSATNPYAEVLDELRAARDTWAPLRAGLFGGQADKLLAKAERYGERLARSERYF